MGKEPGNREGVKGEKVSSLGGVKMRCWVVFEEGYTSGKMVVGAWDRKLKKD